MREEVDFYIKKELKKSAQATKDYYENNGYMLDSDLSLDLSKLNFKRGVEKEEEIKEALENRTAYLEKTFALCDPTKQGVYLLEERLDIYDKEVNGKPLKKFSKERLEADIKMVELLHGKGLKARLEFLKNNEKAAYENEALDLKEQITKNANIAFEIKCNYEKTIVEKLYRIYSEIGGTEHGCEAKVVVTVYNVGHADAEILVTRGIIPQGYDHTRLSIEIPLQNEKGQTIKSLHIPERDISRFAIDKIGCSAEIGAGLAKNIAKLGYPIVQGYMQNDKKGGCCIL